MRSTAVLAALLLTFVFAARELRAEEHTAGAGGSPAHADAPADSRAADAAGQPGDSGANLTPDAPGEPVAEHGASEADAQAAEAADAQAAPAMQAAPAHASETDAAPAADDAQTAPRAAASKRRHTVELGPKGYDEQGHEGRVHFVARGDTLWDIAHAYLATPWVWPSIWRDNRNIANPHRIYPGDRIWITDGEMRVVSAEEAQQLIEREPPAAPAPELAAAPAPEPAAEPESRPLVITLNNNHLSGFVTPQELEASASVVEGFVAKQMHALNDEVYVGLGEGQAKPADILQAYRSDEKVVDPETRRVIGYHVDLLGRVEVTQVHPETSTGIVRQSTSEIELGDRVIPYEPIPHEIEVKPAPADLQGQVAFFAKSRTQVAQEDFVYLNRGRDHGLSVGSALEAYRPGRRVRETARGENVMLPDRAVAQLLVVRVQPAASTAVVLHSETEIQVGDRVRASTYAPLAAR
jgi:hypothetical protein